MKVIDNKLSELIIFESFPIIAMNLYTAWKGNEDFDPRVWNSFFQVNISHFCFWRLNCVHMH